ncbi:P-loop NTPase fold protein [Methanosarcina sp. T3]|uniref:P-loop NTPase fold protein n=1 Tax=Methanosarcina sp. T3 TaxID=3439062 RepID=UPI003F85350A
MTDDLKSVYHLFSPDKALFDEELKKYYVAIGENETRISKLKTRLELGLETGEPIKILFTGHRGSGKSTALNRLVSHLSDNFFVVNYNVLDLLDPNDINYTDVLLSILAQLIENAKVNKIFLRSDLVERANKWGQTITENLISSTKEGLGFGVGLPALINIFTWMKNETETRKEIRKEIGPRVSELISIINDTVIEIEDTGKQVLVIIDNLEKSDPEKALDLFGNHGTQLSQPKCKIIYTFPISLKSSDRFTQIRMNFSDDIMYPNIKVHEPDGSVNRESKERALMKEIVARRVSSDLFEPEALEYIIDMSGGVLRDYIRIIRDSAVTALTRGKRTIDRAVAEEVVTDLKNTYQAQLSDDDYEILREVSRSKNIKRDRDLVGLLHNLSVLEYTNGRSWCDLHPIVRTILEEKHLLQ